jgi:arylsulfatase A-like enzyme
MSRWMTYVIAAMMLAACGNRSTDDRSKPSVIGTAQGAERAGQIQSGVPGSPSAKMTIDGARLPSPPPHFGGKIGQTAATSKPWWPPQIVPPKNAPNVLLIMTDDAGYGVSSTFGGVIPTPTMDRIASMGLRYTQFHSTALCSPSRAALITGRNHHSVGAGVVAEQATGFPGYDGIIGIENATIARILKEHGYATSWFGKNHNTPTYQYGAAGPFDQWPTGMGFDYFYGFMGGETDQYTPFLFRNTTQIYPWRENPNYNLVTGMADDAISYLHDLNASAPDKPFFLHFVPGATHAPHQPTKEWIAKFKGKFDMGWNKLREQIFENQKRLGVIPKNTRLTDWPTGQPEYGGIKLPMWDSLRPDEKKLFARQAEVYAAYVAYTDYEIGRVIQAVENMGKLDNTIIIYICGDNGTSSEGSMTGTPFDLAALQGISIPVAKQMPFYDQWGGPGHSILRSSGSSRSRHTSAARDKAW